MSCSWARPQRRAEDRALLRAVAGITLHWTIEKQMLELTNKACEGRFGNRRRTFGSRLTRPTRVTRVHRMQPLREEPVDQRKPGAAGVWLHSDSLPPQPQVSTPVTFASRSATHIRPTLSLARALTSPRHLSSTIYPSARPLSTHPSVCPPLTHESSICFLTVY